ncbi:hypothetical protein Tco_1293104 [Tanacetum coccineum]
MRRLLDRTLEHGITVMCLTLWSWRIMCNEEEEHLAPADSTAVASPAVDHVPSVKETKPFETNESAATPPPPPPVYRTTSRMYVRSQAHIPFPSEAEVARLLTLPTLPPSPLTPLSSHPPPVLPMLRHR